MKYPGISREGRGVERVLAVQVVERVRVVERVKVGSLEISQKSTQSLRID